MNAHVQAVTLEEQNGDVVRLQHGGVVSHVNPHAIEQMVTVGFHHHLVISIRTLAEQAAEGGLGARMEMHFRLLQQQQWSLFPAQGTGDLDNDRQHLTDAVADIDQVPPRAFQLPAALPDLYLKRFTFLASKLPDGDFVEQPRGSSESLKHDLDPFPLRPVAEIDIGKVHGDIVPLGIDGGTRRIVSPTRLGTNRSTGERPRLRVAGRLHVPGYGELVELFLIRIRERWRAIRGCCRSILRQGERYE